MSTLSSLLNAKIDVPEAPSLSQAFDDIMSTYQAKRKELAADRTARLLAKDMQIMSPEVERKMIAGDIYRTPETKAFFESDRIMNQGSWTPDEHKLYEDHFKWQEKATKPYTANPMEKADLILDRYGDKEIDVGSVAAYRQKAKDELAASELQYQKGIQDVKARIAADPTRALTAKNVATTFNWNKDIPDKIKELWSGPAYKDAFNKLKQLSGSGSILKDITLDQAQAAVYSSKLGGSSSKIKTPEGFIDALKAKVNIDTREFNNLNQVFIDQAMGGTKSPTEMAAYGSKSGLDAFNMRGVVNPSATVTNPEGEDGKGEIKTIVEKLSEEEKNDIALNKFIEESKKAEAAVKDNRKLFRKHTKAIRDVYSSGGFLNLFSSNTEKAEKLKSNLEDLKKAKVFLEDLKKNDPNSYQQLYKEVYGATNIITGVQVQWHPSKIDSMIKKVEQDISKLVNKK